MYVPDSVLFKVDPNSPIPNPNIAVRFIRSLNLWTIECTLQVAAASSLKLLPLLRLQIFPCVVFTISAFPNNGMVCTSTVHSSSEC